jgi:hypothetical protein
MPIQMVPHLQVPLNGTQSPAAWQKTKSSKGNEKKIERMEKEHCAILSFNMFCKNSRIYLLILQPFGHSNSRIWPSISQHTYI